MKLVEICGQFQKNIKKAKRKESVMNNDQNNVQPQEVVQASKPLTMKWYKFLVYFALWAGALVNISSAGNIISGNIYNTTVNGVTSTAEKIYSTYGPQLKTFDTVRAILFLLPAVIGILAAVMLLKYKAAGPKLLLGLYAANAVVSAISTIGENMIANTVYPAPLNTSALVTSVAIAIIMIGVNKTYFDKRAHLFTK